MIKTLKFNDVKEQFPYRLSKREQQDIDRCCARLFTTEDGKIVLGWLQSLAFDRHFSADTPGEQLKFQDGQRAIIAHLMRCIARGKS